MNSEALRLLEKLCKHATVVHDPGFRESYDQLRALLSAQEPTAEHWRQAIELWFDSAMSDLEWYTLDKFARDLAKQEAK